MFLASLSVRRAWIEIDDMSGATNRIFVALRKESVDRNPIVPAELTTLFVALRKESVDRNINCNSNSTQKKQSLSVRRAWIEILQSLGLVFYWYCRSP